MVSALAGPPCVKRRNARSPARLRAALQAAVVTVGALIRGIIFVHRMRKFQALGLSWLIWSPLPWARNQMAGVAVVGFDHPLCHGRDMLSVVAAETAGEILVADVVRVGPPAAFISGKKLSWCKSAARWRWPGGCADPAGNCWPGWWRCLAWRWLIFVRAAQDALGVGLDVGQAGDRCGPGTWPD
jgi:hypothetical protein